MICPWFPPGPHFIDYLGYEVTPECCVVLKCKVSRNFVKAAEAACDQHRTTHHPSTTRRDPFQVGNMKKETSALWYKDGHEIKSEQNLGFTEGVLKLEIAQVGMLGKTF